MGRKAHTHMLVSNDVDIVLIGTTTLEILCLDRFGHREAKGSHDILALNQDTQ